MKRAAASATLVLILIFGAFLTSHAQLLSTDPLTVTIDPSYPKPYETVTVTPDSNTFDMTGATLKVSVNGAVVNQTSGAEPTYVTMGGPGSVSKITVTVVNAGRTYTKTMEIRPADVSLVVEPTSTTHPFYQGASLVAPEGDLRLVAVPDLRTSNGAILPADKLVYTWRFGEQILTAASGIGKSVLTAAAPPRYRDSQVTVTVTTQDQNIVAETSTNISPVDPVIRMYHNDPLLGPWFGTALPESFTMTDTEDTYRAVPYYFAAAPAITWSVNGLTSGTNRDITVRSTGAGSGTALVEAGANGNNESATAATSISFGSGGSLGFFGL